MMEVAMKDEAGFEIIVLVVVRAGVRRLQSSRVHD
jgi:hypothetical protein